MSDMQKKITLSFEAYGKDELLKGIVDIEAENVKLRKTQQKLNEKIKSSTIIDKEKVKELVKTKQSIADNNKLIREKTKLYQASVAQDVKKDDSIKGIAERLRLMRTQYDNLSKTERENEKVGGALLKNIQDLDAEYKDLTASTGRFQSSVGDYSNAIQDAIDGKTNLKKSLREMKDEMTNMTLAGKQGTDQYKQLRNEVARVEDAISKVSTESKRFANDFKVVQDVVDMTNFMVQGFSLVTSTMALMGVENENLEKTIKNMVAVGNVANSVNNMTNIIMKNQHVLTKITIGLKAGWVAVTKALTASTYALSTALKAVGIGLIIAAVAGLVIGIRALIKNFKEVINWLVFWKDLSAENIEITKSYTDVLNELAAAQDKNISSMEKEIERMKAKGKSIDDIKKKEKELIEAQIEAQKIRMQLAFMESASLDKTSEERAEASEKFFEEMEKLDAIYHQLEIFEISEIKRQEEQTEKLRQETIKRIEIRNTEIQAEQNRLDDINRRNELAEAELNYILNNSLENRLKILDIQHKHRLATTEMTHAEIELAEAQHQQRVQNIIDEVANDMLEKQNQIKEEQKTADEIERENQRNIYLNELEQRRLADMTYFEQRQELLNGWFKTGVLTEAEYTKEVERNNKARIKSELDLARQKAMINMSMTATLLNNLSAIADGNEKMFIFQKRASQLEAIINTYVGITQVLRDSTLPTYAKIAAVAAVLSTGLMTVAKIQNQQPPAAPTFRDGGGIIIDGPSHEGGGVPIYAGNQYVGEAEGDEMISIISKRNVKKAGLLDGVMDMHKSSISNTNGFFRNGAIFDPRQDFNNNLAEDIREAVKEIAYIPVIVAVDDINDGQDEKREVLVKGNLK